MTSRPPRFSRIEVEASDWVVAMSDPWVSIEKRTRFEAWLNASPEHQRVYQVQQEAWAAIPHMPHLLDEAKSSNPNWPALREQDESAAMQGPERRRGKGRGAWPIAIAAALAGLTVGAFLLSSALPIWGAGSSFDTRVAQVKAVRLDDGTLVTLGASSHIDVDFRKRERRVVLTRGEAFFEVTRDKSRPFFVTAGQTVVRVVGTKFDVHYGAEAIRVAVLEGRVEVSKADDAAFGSNPGKGVEQVLTPGRLAVARRTGEIAATAAVKTEDLGAWRNGRLVYIDTHLRDIVADINRYYQGKVELADETAGDMQLTTAFRVDQIDRVLEALQSALPIEATHTADGRIILSEKPAQP